MMDSGSTYHNKRISVEKAVQKLKHFCGYQERSHFEVKQKCYSLGLIKKEVEEIMSRLIEEEYLNEERFAAGYVSGKSRIKGWGRQKIRYALRLKGISDYCIKKALSALNEEEYLTGFNRQADKKWRQLQPEKDIFVKKRKWQLFLLQKGFEPEIIKTWPFPQENDAGTPSD
jgi:regulatory protein